MWIFILILMVGYLIYRSHTVIPVVHQHPEPFVKPEPKVSHPTITLLLMGPNGKIKHEIAVHLAQPPTTYEYGDVTYRFFGIGANGAVYVA